MTTKQDTLTIWTDVKFSDDLMQQLSLGIAPHRLIFPSDNELQNSTLVDADVAFGQPNSDQAMHLTKLQWVHLSSAGYTAYDRDDFREELRSQGRRLTTSSGVFNEPCSQHILAMMMAFARRLPDSLVTQLNDRDWIYTERRQQSFLLNGQKAVLFGFGEIALRLCELLAPFRMRLYGVRRYARGDEPISIITEANLQAHLSDADHVINILPENSSTRGYFDAQKFERMKPGTLFYNIGRGATVDQNALLNALETGHLAAAYLDVTTPEPLPPDHPLWSAPNCFITPHTAGGYDKESLGLVEHFLENFRRFVSNSDLLNQVI